MRGFCAGWLLAIAFVAASPALAVSVTGVGRFSFSAPASTATELSGISYISGNDYYAISDQISQLYTLHISLNTSTGAINTFGIDASTLQFRNSAGTAYSSSGFDAEGVAFNPTNNTVLVASENLSNNGPKIRIHDLTTGNETGHIDTTTAGDLGIYVKCRDNLAWESMTRQPGTGTLWTANQEATTSDGATSTLSQGGAIRLQRMNSAGAPAGQYAYRLDGNTDSQWSSLSISCVSDLLALPNGELVALERATGSGRPGGFASDMRVRLYGVGFSSATDLQGGSLVNPVYATKTLLWQQYFDASDNNQFEGITLGPKLANGDSSILMIADNSAGTTHTLYALRATGVPEPVCGALMLLMPGLGGRWRFGRRESKAL